MSFADLTKHPLQHIAALSNLSKHLKTKGKTLSKLWCLVVPLLSLPLSIPLHPTANPPNTNRSPPPLRLLHSRRSGLSTGPAEAVADARRRAGSAPQIRDCLHRCRRAEAAEPQAALSCGDVFSQPQAALSCGDVFSQPQAALSCGDVVSQPQAALSRGDVLSQPQAALSRGDVLSLALEDVRCMRHVLGDVLSDDVLSLALRA